MAFEVTKFTTSNGETLERQADFSTVKSRAFSVPTQMVFRQLVLDTKDAQHLIEQINILKER